MVHRENLAVALLAGGQSTRMGKDKSCLILPDGNLLWRAVFATLESVGAEEKFISCRKSQDQFLGSDAQLIWDRWNQAGPLGGIVSCMEVMTAGQLLVLPVDMPSVTPSLLEYLLKAAGTSGAVYVHKGRLEPLVAVYPACMLAEGQRMLNEGEFALRKWIKRAGNVMNVIDVPLDMQDQFVNLNENRDWQHWRDNRPQIS